MRRETSQPLKRYLQNKDYEAEKSQEQMSREKHLWKANKNLKKFISLGSFSIGGGHSELGKIDSISLFQQALKTKLHLQHNINVYV